jgi:membrane protein implicated in regulation of membrane protease activity
MDWLQPSALAAALTEAGTKKANLSTKTILTTGILSGMFLGFTTTLFVSALVAVGSVPVAALFFPIGFIMLVLLGLELFTGNVALIPYALMAGKVSGGKMVKAVITVYIGNLIGSLIYALIFALIDTKCFTDAPDRQNRRLREIRRRRLVRCVPQRCRLQLDGQPRRRHGAGHPLHHRQNLRHVPADHGLRRARLRALRRQHVRHPLRHHAGRECERRAVVDVERNSRHTW